jgi:hypothetical protein
MLLRLRGLLVLVVQVVPEVTVVLREVPVLGQTGMVRLEVREVPEQMRTSVGYLVLTILRLLPIRIQLAFRLELKRTVLRAALVAQLGPVALVVRQEVQVRLDHPHQHNMWAV